MTEVDSPTNSNEGAHGRKILLVDDADELLQLYELALSSEGYEVKTAPLAERALEIARRWRPDLVVTDLFMPGMGGLELITRLRSDFAPPVPPIVVISGFPDVMAEALKRGACRFETKPVSIEEFLHIVEDVFAGHGAPRLRSPDVVRERRDATRAIGEATLKRYLSEDPDAFARSDALARALARFFGHSALHMFVLRQGQLTLAASSDPALPHDGDCAGIMPLLNDVVETGGALVITNSAAQWLVRNGSTEVRFLVAVPWLVDGAAIGVFCLVDRTSHDFSAAALGILEYIARRGAAVLRSGPRIMDDSGLFEHGAFAAVLQGSALLARDTGHALGFAIVEVAEVPRDRSLTPLLTNLPAANLMVGVLDRHHVAVFAFAESAGLVRERLELVRRDLARHLTVVRTGELTYEDPVPLLEPDGFASRARELLTCAATEDRTFLAVDAIRRSDPVGGAQAGQSG